MASIYHLIIGFHKRYHWVCCGTNYIYNDHDVIIIYYYAKNLFWLSM